ERVADVVRSEVVTEPNGLAEKDFVALAEIFDDDIGDSAVGNGNDGAFFGAKFGGTQANVFYGAALIAYTTSVTNLQSSIGQDRDSAEQIFKGFLRAEADGQAADAQPGKRGGDVNAKAAERDKTDNDESDDLKNTAQEGDYGALAHAPAGGE